MGRIKQQVDFDWAGADASFQRAVAVSYTHLDVYKRQGLNVAWS